MKYYIVGHSRAVFVDSKGLFTTHLEKAKEHSLREAKEAVLKLNQDADVVDGVAYSIIPAKEEGDKSKTKKLEQEYLIWCFAREMFWKSHRQGYTRRLDEAGVYSAKDAIEVCKKANIHGLEEAMIPITGDMRL